VQYHDTEWGVPVHDDRLLFEFLILEGAQAGLSWETILNKRENYRAAFDLFDPVLVGKYGQKKRMSLLSDIGILGRQAATAIQPGADQRLILGLRLGATVAAKVVILPV
jgi:DNA-3-methyladenine glycosylase I